MKMPRFYGAFFCALLHKIITANLWSLCMTKGKTIIKGAFILTLANLVTRIMGFMYRVFMSKALGAHGLGVFQLIMPVYMLVFSLCASGLATTVSNYTAAHAANNDNGGIGKILDFSVYLSLFLSLIACMTVFFGAEAISVNILHEHNTFIALRIISLCFPFMCVGAVLRGYFYGLQKMSVPAASQVLEQSIRIALVYFLCDKMLARGLKYACAMAVMGMACGEMASFLFTLAVFMPHRKRLKTYTTLSDKAAAAAVISACVPLTLNRGISSFLSTAEHILIPSRLMLHGMTNEQALSLFGGLCGMAAPLVMFPCSLLTALAAAIMPAISEFHAVQNKKAVAKTLNSALLFTTVFGVLASAVFIAFPREISLVVYGRDDITPILRLLGFICPFLYTQVIMSAALNGINCQLYIFKMGLLGSAITLFAVFFLMPRYGLHAYIAGWAVSAVITNRLSALRLAKASDSFGTDVLTVFKCIVSAALVSICGVIFLRRFGNSGNILRICVISCCCIFYFILLKTLGVISRDTFPK